MKKYTNNNNAETLITRAKIQLLINHPFFATLALSMPFEPVATIPTAATDGERIIYNPGFIESLSLDEIQGVIAHEIMHVTGLHHMRREGRDPKQWNKACDYAINPLIIDSGLSLPKGRLIDRQYAGMSAEQIFKHLPQQQDDDYSGNDDPGGCGGVMDTPARSESERQQKEAQIKQKVAQAEAAARQEGKLPAHLQRAISDILSPVVKWKEVLARFFDQIARNDYTWTRPNDRYIAQGLYLPALRSLEIGKFVLMVDTSGSVDDELLKQFAGEISEIAETWNVGFTVLHVDTEINHVQEFEAGDTITPHGGGGTDFRPGFDWIADQDINPAAVVYFTDGYCNSFPQHAPDYPVLWGVYGPMARDFIPPFGEVVPILSN